MRKTNQITAVDTANVLRTTRSSARTRGVNFSHLFLSFFLPCALLSTQGQYACKHIISTMSCHRAQEEEHGYSRSNTRGSLFFIADPWHRSTRGARQITRQRHAIHGPLSLLHSVSKLTLGGIDKSVRGWTRALLKLGRSPSACYNPPAPCTCVCTPTHQPIAQSERYRILFVLALLVPLLVLLVPLVLLPFVISRAGRTAGGVSTRHGAEPLVVPRLPDLMRDLWSSRRFWDKR